MERVKHLSEIKGDRAFDAYAALIPAVTAMAQDDQAVEYFSGNGPKTRLENAAALMEIAARNKQSIIEIEAVKCGCPIEQVQDMSMDNIFSACVDLMTDSLFKTFFVLAHRDMVENSSISAPEPTTAPQI